LREAEAHDGPWLVIAHSHRIAHGYDMRDGLDQQYRAAASGHGPLIRYDPVARAAGANPFLLDSPRPRMSLADYRKRELRFPDPGQHRARRGGTPARTRPAGGRPAVADLRRVGHPRPPRTSHPTPARMGNGARHQLHGPAAVQPARGLSRPLSYTLDGIRRLADADVGAVVLFSLFEEQLPEQAARTARLVDEPAESFRKRSATSQPAPTTTPDRIANLSLLERAATTVQIPVIASLDGVTPRAGPTMRARCRTPAPPPSS
jgi:hypothetical protein